MIYFWAILLLFDEPSFAREAVVQHQDYRFEFAGEKPRPWIKPKHAEADMNDPKYMFHIPPGLKKNVEFWIDIYSKYSTEEGVLHDSEFPELVYESVDFKEIPYYESLQKNQVRRAKKKLIKDRKTHIVAILNRLSKLKTGEGLLGEDLRYWKLFENIGEKNKFKEASKKGRLRFQLGQSDRFLQGIYYSGRYIERMEEIFQKMEMPIELTRLPFVESSFNLAARSRVGASGIWQFMRSTGRQYMKVNKVIDQRNDPLMATKAAAKLLRFNYKRLKNWPLAVTAYNYGPSGLVRLVKKAGTSDLVEIIEREKSSRFGFASSNFYASFLAALEVERHAEKYFSKPEWAPTILFEEYRIHRTMHFQKIVEVFNGDKKMTELFNPHMTSRLVRGYYHVPLKTRVRVPVGKVPDLVKKIDGAQLKVAGGVLKYRVLPGDTLSTIAQNFGTSTRLLMEMNSISNPRRIRAGQILHIPRSRQ